MIKQQGRQILTEKRQRKAEEFLLWVAMQSIPGGWAGYSKTSMLDSGSLGSWNNKVALQSAEWKTLQPDMEETETWSSFR